MDDLWLMEFAWPPRVALQGPVWRSVDGELGRAYRPAGASPGTGWAQLVCRLSLPGASNGEPALFHYVVETDVMPQHEDEFNAWYELEHLPGLADVPGTVQAARYVRSQPGLPRYCACYDLTSADTLGSPAWLAVRGTPWSSCVRPMFQHTRRILYQRVDTTNGKHPP